jgi:hypothetical protein
LHSSNREARMSALGQKQTSRSEITMSALPPKADIAGRQQDVRCVPKADILRCSGAGAIRSPSQRAAVWHEATSTVCSMEYLLKRLTVDFENLDRPTGRSVIKYADYKPTGVPR